MRILRAVRALVGKTVRSLTPPVAAVLALVLGFSDFVVAFVATVGVGAGTGDTLLMYGASTGWSLVAAVPAGALAGYGIYRLWWHPFLYGATSLADVFGDLAERIVTALEKQSAGGDRHEADAVR